MKTTAKFTEQYPISFREYWDLESLNPKQKQEQEPLVSRIFQTLVAKLSGNNDPQIKLKYSSSGQEYWHVYDPMTGKAETFATEAEVRIWVEQRYYR
ncbi:MAG: hypothetical protein HC781_06630 [Leptolyngbyaceae cyanobacterium CSU_1_4]|nr:hypothetical protein [Leptolyngbyaceae cyanobacterium CSU_1_4]